MKTGPRPYTKRWYELRKFNHRRRKVFGASEAAAVCGLSPFKSTLQVYLKPDTGSSPEKDS